MAGEEVPVRNSSQERGKGLRSQLTKSNLIVGLALLLIANSLGVGNVVIHVVPGATSIPGLQNNGQPGNGIVGSVISMTDTKNGGHLVMRLDSTSEQIFAPSQVATQIRGMGVHVGSRIQVRGQQTAYNGQPEIKLSGVQDITVLN